MDFHQPRVFKSHFKSPIDLFYTTSYITDARLDLPIINQEFDLTRVCLALCALLTSLLQEEKRHWEQNAVIICNYAALLISHVFYSAYK